MSMDGCFTLDSTLISRTKRKDANGRKGVETYSKLEEVFEGLKTRESARWDVAKVKVTSKSVGMYL